MNKDFNNIEDLFAAARNSEVKITLEQVREKLEEQGSTPLWKWFLPLLAILLLVVLGIKTFLPLPDEHTAQILENHSKVEEIKEDSPVVKDEKIAVIDTIPEVKNTLPKREIVYNKTSVEQRRSIRNLSPVVPIISNRKIETYPNEGLHFIANTILENNAKKELNERRDNFEDSVVFKLPVQESFILEDKKMLHKKSRFIFMKTLENRESISMKTFRKGSKKQLVFNKYNSIFERIKSISLSPLIQGKNCSLHTVESFNDQLLIITKTVSKKDKTIEYQGHLFDYQRMKIKKTKKLAEIPYSKSGTDQNIQVSENGKFLLVNSLPEKPTVKSTNTLKNPQGKRAIPFKLPVFTKRRTPKSISAESKFFVFDKNLKLFNKIKQPRMTSYETAIDNKGTLFLWKPKMNKPAFVSLPKDYAKQYILSTFGNDSSNSMQVKASSFRGLQDSSVAQAGISDSVDLNNLKLLLNPKGKPILFGYLNNNKGLQYLSFSDTLSPVQHSVLSFDPYFLSKKDESHSPVFVINEAFFDKNSHLNVLSGMYANFSDTDLSNKKYISSEGIALHQFNAEGKPLFTTGSLMNFSEEETEAPAFSYLYEDNNMALIFPDKKQNNDRESEDKKMLSVNALKMPAELLQTEPKNNNIENYLPLDYFHHKDQTITLLKGKKDFKIIYLHYGKAINIKTNLD